MSRLAINAGTVRLSNGGSELNAYTTVANGAAFEINRSDAVTLFRGVQATSGATLRFMGTGTTTLSLSDTRNFISGANVLADRGRLLLSATNSTASRFASDITNNGVVEMRYSGTSHNFGKVISSTGSFVKSGTANLTLSGTNTYTGATSVTAGSLVVNGSLANTTLNVTNGATLGGSGSIIGTTTIEGGGIHAPGNSPGLQSFTNLTYAKDSIFSWEIDRIAPHTRGTGYDAVNVSGTLSGADAVFRIVIGDTDFSNTFWSTPRSWTNIFTHADGTTVIANWANIFSGGFEYFNTSGEAITAPPAGSFTLTGNTLAWSAVPEPSSALAGLLIAAGLLRRRR